MGTHKSEECGIRSEEWRKGRTIHIGPQYPLIKVIILLLSISNIVIYTEAVKVIKVMKGYVSSVVS